MAELTESQVFTVRELALRGFATSRIAALVDAPEWLVDVVLNPQRAEPSEPPEPVREVLDVPEPVDAAPVWPPAVDESTEWDTIRVSRGYGQRAGEVRVRWTKFWGRRVQVNAAGEVWCPSCQKFRTVAELSSPFNHCPVGLRLRGGVVVVDDSTDDGPPALGGRGFVDFMAMKW